MRFSPANMTGNIQDLSKLNDVTKWWLIIQMCQLSRSVMIPFDMGWPLVGLQQIGPRGRDLILHKALREQGMVSAATLSCTYLPTDFCAAWLAVQGQPVELALEGVAWIVGATTMTYLKNLPQSLQHLIFGEMFDMSLKRVTLPCSLQTLTFGSQFNKSFTGVTLPNSLQTLTFSEYFNQSLKGVTLTFGERDNQSLEGVNLPSSLQTLIFGQNANHSLGGVTMPSSLQTLTFGNLSKQSLQGVNLPNSLQTSDLDIWLHLQLELGRSHAAK